MQSLYLSPCKLLAHRLWVYANPNVSLKGDRQMQRNPLISTAAQRHPSADLSTYSGVVVSRSVCLCVCLKVGSKPAGLRIWCPTTAPSGCTFPILSGPRQTQRGAGNSLRSALPRHSKSSKSCGLSNRISWLSVCIHRWAALQVSCAPPCARLHAMYSGCAGIYLLHLSASSSPHSADPWLRSGSWANRGEGRGREPFHGLFPRVSTRLRRPFPRRRPSPKLPLSY